MTSVPFPQTGYFLSATPDAPEQLQNRLFLVFFSDPSQGLMAWDLSRIDDDILFPVLVRKFHLEDAAAALSLQTRDILNGGTSSLQPHTERDFFLVHDLRPTTKRVFKVGDYLSYVVLSSDPKRVTEVDDLHLDRFVLVRGFFGLDAEPLAEQLSLGWWRFMPADPDIIFNISADKRLSAVYPTRGVH